MNCWLRSQEWSDRQHVWTISEDWSNHSYARSVPSGAIEQTHTCSFQSRAYQVRLVKDSEVYQNKVRLWHAFKEIDGHVEGSLPRTPDAKCMNMPDNTWLNQMKIWKHELHELAKIDDAVLLARFRTRSRAIKQVLMTINLKRIRTLSKKGKYAVPRSVLSTDYRWEQRFEAWRALIIKAADDLRLGPKDPNLAENESPKDEEHRLAHRRAGVEAVKRTEEYLEKARRTSLMARGGEDTLLELPQTPDASDLAVSKRSWERSMKCWRDDLRTLCKMPDETFFYRLSNRTEWLRQVQRSAEYYMLLIMRARGDEAALNFASPPNTIMTEEPVWRGACHDWLQELHIVVEDKVDPQIAKYLCVGDQECGGDEDMFTYQEDSPNRYH